jgi:hypothetical protein
VRALVAVIKEEQCDKRDSRVVVGQVLRRQNLLVVEDISVRYM